MDDVILCNSICSVYVCVLCACCAGVLMCWCLLLLLFWDRFEELSDILGITLRLRIPSFFAYLKDKGFNYLFLAVDMNG